MAPFNWMDDFGGAYEDYSSGGDTSWMQPNLPKRKPWEYDYSPANYAGLDYMSDTSPYQIEPYQAPSYQSQTLAPNRFAPDYMKPRFDPWSNLFPTQEQAQARPKPVNDPLSVARTFPTPVDFMATEETQPTLPLQEERKKERQFPLLDRFADLAWNKPRREDYRGGKMNALMAALAGGVTGFAKGGGAGYAAAQQIREAPYMRAMEDWKEQLQAGKDAATLERYQAENLRKGEYGESLLKFKTDKQRQDYEVATQRARAVGLQVKDDPDTGMSWAIDITGNAPPRLIGKFGMSTQEKIDFAGSKAKAESAGTLEDRKALLTQAADAAQKGREYNAGQDWSRMLSGQAFQEATQRRGAEIARTSRIEQAGLDMLKTAVGKEYDRNNPRTVVSANEALRRSWMEDEYSESKYFTDGKIDPEKIKLDPEGFKNFQIRWKAHLDAGR